MKDGSLRRLGFEFGFGSVAGDDGDGGDESPWVPPEFWGSIQIESREFVGRMEKMNGRGCRRRRHLHDRFLSIDPKSSLGCLVWFFSVFKVFVLACEIIGESNGIQIDLGKILNAHFI